MKSKIQFVSLTQDQNIKIKLAVKATQPMKTKIQEISLQTQNLRIKLAKGCIYLPITDYNIDKLLKSIWKTVPDWANKDELDLDELTGKLITFHKEGNQIYLEEA